MAHQNRESWHVKDEAILHELIALMNLSPAEQTLLGALAAQAGEQASAMTQAFYTRLFAHDHTADYLKDAAMDRLHSMLGDWFKDLFTGSYGAAYARKRLEIGHVHVRVGLPVRYPLAMLDIIAEHGEIVARQSPQPEQAVIAFRKVLALDVAIFNQAYEDSQLKYLSELVGGERLARLLLTGQG
jgi:hypothetical protein